MASVRAASAANRNRVQGVSAVMAALQGAQQTGQESLEAEFSRLVEQIAGQVEFADASQQISADHFAVIEVAKVAPRPAERPSQSDQQLTKDQKNPSPESNTSASSSDPEAPKSDTKQSEEGEGQEERTAEGPEGGAPEAAPTETTESKEVSQDQVAAGIAAATVAQTSSKESAIPLTSEKLPEGEAEAKQDEQKEQSPEDAQAEPTAQLAPQAPTIASKVEVTPGKSKQPRELMPEAPAASELSKDQPPTQVATPVAHVTLQKQEAPDPLAAKALTQIAQALEQPLTPTPAASVLAPKIQVDRDALVASLALRPLLERASNIVEAARQVQASTPSQGPLSFGEHTGASKNTARTQAETNARATRASSRVTFEQALERVEAVAKEVARSKDGSSLTFRLDPPQLGNLKVDVSLREGLLHARLTPESAQVAQLLRERAHELQASLRKLGLSVDSVSVSVSGDSGSASTSGDSRFSSWSEQARSGGKGQVGAGTAVGENVVPGAGNRPASTIDHWVA